MKPETTQEVIKKLEELRDSLQQTENSYATNKCVEILALIVVPERKRLLYSIGMTYNSELKGFYFHNKRDSVFFDWQIEGFDNANFEASFNWFKQNSHSEQNGLKVVGPTVFVGIQYTDKNGKKTFVKPHPLVKKEIEIYLNQDYHEEDVHEIATAHKRLIEMDDGSTEVVSEENLNNINQENFHIVEILKQNPK